MPYQVIKASKKDFIGVGMGKEKNYFNRGGVFNTNDAALAKDIRQKFGQDRRGTGDVIVARFPDKTTGNKFSVGIAFDEDGNVIRR